MVSFVKAISEHHIAKSIPEGDHHFHFFENPTITEDPLNECNESATTEGLLDIVAMVVENNVGKLSGMKDTNLLECGLKLDRKGLSFREANGEDCLMWPKQIIFYLFWSIALEGKGSLLAKHQGVKVSTCWCKDEVDRLLGTKATSPRFSIAIEYRFLFFFFPP